MSLKLELGTGSGVVAAVGGVALFVADASAARRVVDVAREAVAAGSPPGRGFARRLAALLTGDDADGVPDFGALADAGTGWVVFLYGGVAATVVAADGTETRLTGRESATWVDRLLPADAGRVLIAPDEAGDVGETSFELEAGVVPGGWLRVVPSSPVATTADVAAAPVAGAPAGDGATSELPTLVPSGATATPRPPTPPAGDFESFSLAPIDVEAPEPLPIERATDTTAAAGDAAVLVQGIRCGQQHFNRPDAQFCTSCGLPIESQAQRVVSGPRPSLGLLVFDDGSTFTLDSEYVLGREPETDAAVADGTARPIALDDPGDTVSRVHAEIRLDDWDVQLVDRGSTNGTHIWDESRGAWDRLVPDESRVVRPGDRGAVGQRTFVYEPAHRQ